MLCVCVWLEQKWSKAKSHEKLNSMVLFDQKTYDKMLKDVPKVAAELNPHSLRAAPGVSLTPAGIVVVVLSR